MAQEESSERKVKHVESLTKVLRVKSEGITNDTKPSDIVKYIRVVLHAHTTLNESHTSPSSSSTKLTTTTTDNTSTTTTPNRSSTKLTTPDMHNNFINSTNNNSSTRISQTNLTLNSHVLRIQINHDKKMAFVELDSKETATAVLMKYTYNNDAPLFNNEKCEIATTTRDTIKIPVPANQIDMTYHEFLQGDYEGRLAFAPPPPRVKRQGNGLYEVEVIGFEIQDGKTALFQIVLYEEDVKRTQVLKRYSEIYTLHENLTKLKDVWALVVIKNLKFPPKTLTKSLDNKFLESRQQQLQEYFDDLFTRFNKAKLQIAAVPLLSEFFGFMKS